MSNLLANLVGAAGAALNLRSPEASPRPAREVGSDPSFASALSAALGPRQRSLDAAPAERSHAADLDNLDDGVDEADTAATVAQEADAAPTAPAGRSAATADASTDADMALAGPSSSAATSGPGPARRPTAVRRGLEGLDPEFRERLERVIARMEGEFGFDVQIVETVRDQARQDYLYAQGRTRPGPVVTWTRNSNHLSGRAADLMVDGTYDHPVAMKLLARIAREEGLRTLGARDPGHIELPAGARVERLAVATGASPLLDGAASRAADGVRVAMATQEAMAGGAASAPAGPARVAGVARVARVAEVAQLAEPARVATVARVATPGAPASAGVDGPSAPATPTPAAGAALAASSGGEGGAASGDTGNRDGHTAHGDPAAEVEPGNSRIDPAALLIASEPRAGNGAPGEAGGLPASFGADAAERIARVLQLQDTPSARALSQVVLRLDNAAGGEDRIRVDLRGSSVGAALEVGDPLTAARLQSELGQLQRALEGKGLQAEHLSVSGHLAHRELAEALRGALAGEAGHRPSQDPGPRGEGWGGRSQGDRQESDSEQPRQHPRRQTQQERNT